MAERAVAGQAVYTKRVLHVYDLFVLGFSNRFVWRCPTPALLAHYDRHVTANHLDVGVGTGYFLDRCHFPSAAAGVDGATLLRSARRPDRSVAA